LVALSQELQEADAVVVASGGPSPATPPPGTQLGPIARGVPGRLVRWGQVDPQIVQQGSDLVGCIGALEVLDKLLLTRLTDREAVGSEGPAEPRELGGIAAEGEYGREAEDLGVAVEDPVRMHLRLAGISVGCGASEEVVPQVSCRAVDRHRLAIGA